MSPNELVRIAENFSVLGLVKVVLIIGIAVYVFFSFLMMKQIGLMSKAVRMRDDYVVKILGTAHFVFSILVLFVAFLIL